MRIQPRVLICDDDRDLQTALKIMLGKTYDVRSAYTPEESRVLVKNYRFDLILMDLNLSTPKAGLEILPVLIDAQPEVQIVFFSAETDFEYVREAMRLGASDYVPKTAGIEEIRIAVQRSLERKNLKNRQKQSDSEIKRRDRHLSLIGNSPEIQNLKRMMARVQNSDCSILIEGETGCGKEIVARSLRRTLEDGTLEPFVCIDSSTIQASVAESLLFGYEKGAFTGAEKTTRGLFEEANGGTIYFDEIGNMPIEIQNKLLRVLQEKEVLRLGSSRTIPLDFRVISATSTDMEKAVKEGKFRDDLYQRLNTLHLQIPPLRERISDLPALIEHFCIQLKGNHPILKFPPSVIEALAAYPFPGNVRELQNIVRYLYTLCESDQVGLFDLPPKVQKYVLGATAIYDREKNSITHSTPTDTESFHFAEPPNFYEEVANFEKSLLRREYARFDGNVSKMANGLQMDRSYLFGKLKGYGIHTPSAKRS